MTKSDYNFTFVETESQKAELGEVLERLKDQRGADIPALQEAQRIYGYLPRIVVNRIAQALGRSVEKLYSTATFYSQFTFAPKGEYTINVCLGTACYVKGAGDVLDQFSQKLGIKPGETTPDGAFTLESCRCIGACGLAPVLTVNEEVHGRLTKNDAEKILAIYNRFADNTTEEDTAI